MRSPRFQLRTLLILVMLAGIAVGGYEIWRRSERYRARSVEAETQEHEWAKAASILRTKSVKAEVAGLRDYYAALKRKYQHAARHPWLPVAPDPPEPKLRGERASPGSGM